MTPLHLYNGSNEQFHSAAFYEIWKGSLVPWTIFICVVYKAYTSSVQRKGADYAARALKSMIQGLGQIFQLFLKIWVMKVIAESMVKKLFVDVLGGKIGF